MTKNLPNPSQSAKADVDALAVPAAGVDALAVTAADVDALAVPAADVDALAVPAKAEARAHALAVRRMVHADSGTVAAEKLALYAGLLTFSVGTVVAGYFPMGEEIDPTPLLENLMGRGCTLALPVVTARDQPLEFRRWEVGDVLEKGPHGTVHPLAAAPKLCPQLLLVPLLAFDLAGFRLGYGGGYYDRTLAQLRAKGPINAIGLAYGGQRMTAVPHDHLDQRLDLILTENGPITPENS